MRFEIKKVNLESVLSFLGFWIIVEVILDVLESF